MNRSEDSRALAALEELFTQWVALDWSPEHESALFANLVKQTDSLLTKDKTFGKFIPIKGYKVENEKTHLQFIDHYLLHDNWQFRVCALIYLRVPHHTSHRLRPELEERFWLAFNDPYPRVVRFFIRLILYLEYPLFDYKTLTFTPIPLSKTQLRSFDIDRLLYQLSVPRKYPKIRAEYFWRVVCYVTTRIHLGDGPQMTPYLHELIELYLQEPFVPEVRHGDDYPRYDLLFELELLRLGLRYPPPQLKRQWLHEALRLFKLFAENEQYDTEEFWCYEHEGYKYGWPDPFIDDLGITILQTQDLTILREFITSYQAPFASWTGFTSTGHKRQYKTHDGFGHDILINRATYLLFPYALALGWQEGAHFLLLNFIENAMGRTLWDDRTDAWVDYVESMKQLSELLEQYRAAGAPITQDLLEELWEFYEYLEDESVQVQLPDDLREQFIQIGHHLYQTRNTQLLAFCVKNQFVPALLGILKDISSPTIQDGPAPRAPFSNQMGMVVILESILERYKALWWETPHPISWEKHWYELSYGYDDESAFARNALLQLLAEFFLNPIPQKELWRTALSHLYQAHEIWVPRLLVDLLYFTSAYTSEWLTCFTNIGSIWAQNEDMDDIDVNKEEDWARLILLGCQVHPVAHKLLLQYTENQTHSLPRRELALLVQTSAKR